VWGGGTGTPFQYLPLISAGTRYPCPRNLNIDLDDFSNFIETTFSRKRVETGEKVSFKIKERTKRLVDELSNRITPDKEYLSIELNEYRDSFLTIHKSKGLQADAALVVAKNEKELLMWLENDKEKRLNDQQDKCRLGYVAFSRPKEFLCIACLTAVSESTLELLDKLYVKIYNPLEVKVQVLLPTNS
jgi:DNA helicase II / ATP-dependent DNA helicase PcrA